MHLIQCVANTTSKMNALYGYIVLNGFDSPEAIYVALKSNLIASETVN